MRFRATLYLNTFSEEQEGLVASALLILRHRVWGRAGQRGGGETPPQSSGAVVNDERCVQTAMIPVRLDRRGQRGRRRGRQMGDGVHLASIVRVTMV